MKEPDHTINLTSSEVRAHLDGTIDLGVHEDIESAFDQAQGEVHTGEKEESTILLVIRKG